MGSEAAPQGHGHRGAPDRVSSESGTGRVDFVGGVNGAVCGGSVVACWVTFTLLF